MTLDPATFDTLYAAQAGRLYSTCYRILRDEQQAQDAVQEAWVRAFTRPDDAPIDNPAAWLTTVARNAALDQYRRRKRLAPLAEEADDEEATAPYLVENDPYSDPAKAVPARDSERLALALIDELRPDQERLLQLHYVDGVPIPELAAILGKTANATTVALHRARAALRSRYVERVFARAALPETCRARKAELVVAAADGPRSADLAAHLETCPYCSESLTELRTMSSAWAIAPVLVVPAALKASVLTALAAKGVAVGTATATAGVAGAATAPTASTAAIASGSSVVASHTGIIAALLTAGFVGVAAGVLILGQPALAHQHKDVFVEIGPMAGPHGRGTATALQDGTVLIAYGGLNVRGPGLDLFQPASQTFAAKPGGIFNRDRQTATLLPDGTVLMAGGTYNGLGLSTGDASIYDPATRKMHNVKPMSIGRIGHTATLLRDGRVLIIGGEVWQNNRRETLASAEIYDPATGSFTPTGSMTSPRQGQTATLLLDGTVLITGGSDGQKALSSAEVYNPATGVFRAVGSMGVPRRAQTATMLVDGSVLIAGGDDGHIIFASAERYDQHSATFSPVGQMTTPRAAHGAVRLADGSVLLVGGQGPSAALNSAEIFDPGSAEFRTVGAMGGPRMWPLVALLPDGTVLITGGLDSTGVLASAEIFE